MSVLLMKSGGQAALAEWQAAFAAVRPDIEVRWWDDPAVDPASVDYAFVWAPEKGRLRALPNLKLVLSSGAGVDHLGEPEDRPDVPIVRMGAPEAVARMREFTILSVLHMHRMWHRYAANQRAKTWVESTDLTKIPLTLPARAAGQPRVSSPSSIGSPTPGELTPDPLRPPRAPRRAGRAVARAPRGCGGRRR